jgi:transketolase
MNTKHFADQIRINALQMVTQAKASHIGGALSITDILAVLYGEVLKVDPREPKLAVRDRFILSKGHCCVAVYAALALRGFIEMEELKSYAQNGSRLMSHISHKVPGVEFSTGSLGHGLPFGVGKAIAGKRLGAPWRTFVLLSDGELDEGSNWEAMMFAAHHGLDKLVGIIDYNKLQSLDTNENTLRLEPLAEKFAAFGWAVREIDGHDHTALQQALAALPWEAGKPNMLIAHTTKGKGVSFMENRVEWHYKSPSAAQLAQAIDEIGLTS